MKAVSIRKLAKAAEMTENAVKAARRGDRLQRSNVKKLKKAIDAMTSKIEQTKPVKSLL